VSKQDQHPPFTLRADIVPSGVNARSPATLLNNVVALQFGARDLLKRVGNGNVENSPDGAIVGSLADLPDRIIVDYSSYAWVRAEIDMRNSETARGIQFVNHLFPGGPISSTCGCIDGIMVENGASFDTWCKDVGASYTISDFERWGWSFA
jgi:hypothetical protein